MNVILRENDELVKSITTSIKLKYMIIVLNALLLLMNTIALMSENITVNISILIFLIAIIIDLIHVRKHRLDVKLVNSQNTDNWSANLAERNIFQLSWDAAIASSGLQSENKYADFVLKCIDDAAKHSDEHKSKWMQTEYCVIILTAVIALINAVAAGQDGDMAKLSNIIAAVLAAITSIINGIKATASYKETWLRHSRHRSNLVLECDRFALDLDEYQVKQGENEQDHAIRKVKLFQNNTIQMVQKDYDAFYANMGKD